MDYYAHVDSDSHSGGYEAVVRRTNWYMEIRLAVLDTLDMQDTQRNEYRHQIMQYYDKCRMDSAVVYHDKALFRSSAKELGICEQRITLLWHWKNSVLYKAFLKIRKLWCACLRRMRNLRVNTKIWIQNTKGYAIRE